jgi:hypothetical protein
MCEIRMRAQTREAQSTLVGSTPNPWIAVQANQRQMMSENWRLEVRQFSSESIS